MSNEKQIHTEVVDIDDLIQDDHNFNKGTEEGAELIGRSFKEHGAGRSVFIDKNNRLVGGNKAQKGFKGAGYRKVVIIDSDPDTLVAVRRKDVDLDTREGREMALLDNLTTERNLQWDPDELKAIEDQVDGFDSDEWGLDLDFAAPTEDEADKVQEDDFNPDEHYEPRTKPGDIFRLGDHLLMCGDSTDADAVAKLMNGEKAVMTFSDAPYNVDFKGSMSNTTVNGVMVKHKGANTRHEAIHNDKMDKDDFFAFMMKILENIKQNVTGAWYLSFSSVNLEELLNPLRASGMDWKSIIIWMKNQATLSMKDYKSRYEPIVYGRFNDAWYGNRGFEEDIWEYQRTLKNDLHPTMKPVPLIGKMVTDGSKEGEIVLDLFGGSGSTLIACEQLNRQCRMMELDPHFCDVILARWEKLTGQKAIKLNQ